MEEKTNNIIITKETITRLIKDVKHIMKNPLTDNGIYYIHDDEDILKGYAMIIGAKDTPYFGGYYFFKFNFPHDYPFSPPIVTYMTNDGKTRFNPNLYKCGKVCLSILNTWNGDKWSSCQTISTILLTLCSILNEEPFLNEPGKTKTCDDFNLYQRSIEYSNINFAICDMLTKIKILLPQQFHIFYPYMKDTFLQNYDNLLSFIHSKNNIVENLYVSVYSMDTYINYSKLKEKIMNIRTIIDEIKL
jgi:ubiquitin-conjugating enzyme E2 Z